MSLSLPLFTDAPGQVDHSTRQTTFNDPRPPDYNGGLPGYGATLASATAPAVHPDFRPPPTAPSAPPSTASQPSYSYGAPAGQQQQQQPGSAHPYGGVPPPQQTSGAYGAYGAYASSPPSHGAYGSQPSPQHPPVAQAYPPPAGASAYPPQRQPVHGGSYHQAPAVRSPAAQKQCCAALPL